MNNKIYDFKDFFKALESDPEFNKVEKHFNQNETKKPLFLIINTIDGKKLKVYSARMFYLLKANEYANEGFIQTYLTGFENGNKFIKQKNKKDLRGLYSSCPEKYIDELKQFYFDKAPNEFLSYKQIATNYPIYGKVITVIEKIGFASGVINAIDLMEIENPILFENFYNQKQPPYLENIELYKNSVKNYFIENCINKKNEDGTINKIFYGNIFTDYLNDSLNKIDTNEAYSLYKDVAKQYIKTENLLRTNIIEYLISCKKDQIAGIQRHWYEIAKYLKSIEDYIIIIENYKITNDTFKAIKLKQFIVLKLKLIIRQLEDFYIYLTETPIETQINNLITEFERSIDINEINQIEALKNQPQQNEIIKLKKPKKSLFEFINNVKDKETFMLELKNTFPTEQGKSIKAIVLKLVKEQILIYGTKEFIQFYNELKTYFNRDIGTYQSINDVKTVDKETADTIYKKLNSLITTHKEI